MFILILRLVCSKNLSKILLYISFIGFVQAQETQTVQETNTLQREARFVAQEQTHITEIQANQLAQTAELWRNIRAGQHGITPSQDADGGRLINAMGEQGRLIHNEYIVPTLGWCVVVVFGIFLLFYLINGSTKLKNGFSGRLIERWSLTDRSLHWIMAISCLGLMLTGLNIALGRHLLHPWLPADIWATLIYASKTLHDYLGPIFAVFWLVCIIKWMPLQTYKSYDIKWFLSAGGYVHFGPFKDKHPPSGFANAGEKMWFWTLAIFGLVIVISGFMLVLPKLDLMRDTSILALAFHGISAIILIGFTIVHIWMATVLSQGGLESIISGYCDENWALQHHSIWYEELKNTEQLKYKK